MIKKEFDQMLIDKLAQQLEQGTAPWQKPWEPGQLRLPINAKTGKRYQGINDVWLSMQGRKDPRWLTLKQANSIGARVNKGEKGVPILVWKFDGVGIKKDEEGNPVLDKDGQPQKERYEHTRPMIKVYYVFNAEQMTGLPPLESKPVKPEIERHERAEKILKASGAKITHKEGDSAHYDVGQDVIVLPERNQFPSKEGYYATALHELAHWTGHPDRLNRYDFEDHPRGSSEYLKGHAKEEILADMTSLFVGEELGVGSNYKSHGAYIKSWSKYLKDNPDEVLAAIADASKCSRYIINFEEEKEKEQEHQKVEERSRTAVYSKDGKSQYKDAERTKDTPLLIPHSEKDIAKQLAKESGFRIRWDADAKQWFAPKCVDVKETPLARWLPENVNVHVEKGISANPRVAFAEAMRAEGLKLKGLPEMDGKLHRVPTEGDRGSQTSASYVGFLDGKVPAGYIQNFKTGVKINWKFNKETEQLNNKDVLRLMAEAREKNRLRKIEVEQKHEAMSAIAQVMWKEAIPATDQQSYCMKKGIAFPGEKDLKVVPNEVSNEAKAAGIRIGQNVAEVKALRQAEPDARVFMAGDLLIPATDSDGKIWSLQSVNSNFKGFMKEGKKSGLYTVAGIKPTEFKELMEKDISIPVVIAEGYATADTVSKLSGYPVVVAFDSGNLDAVTKEMREQWTNRPLVIAADNDHNSESKVYSNGKTGVNVGVEKAKAAAEKHGGGVVIINFGENDSGSDWNDYAAQYGEETARKELQRQISTAKLESIMNIEKLNQLAAERASEAIDDPTTSLDDTFVSQERAVVADLRAGVTTEKTNIYSKQGQAPVALSYAERTTRNQVEEQRRIVHDGHSISSQSLRATEKMGHNLKQAMKDEQAAKKEQQKESKPKRSRGVDIDL